MKIGIVTQPLLNNYGGYLQAWALQEQLRKMGHEPITINYIPARTKWYRYLFSWIKTILLLCIGKKREFAKVTPPAKRNSVFDSFVNNHLSLTPIVHKYSPKLVEEYGFDAVITGSDQVWRPIYNGYIEDMYLRFVRKEGVKKMAYAASFGVDTWEYTSEQTKKCKRWAQQLNTVSVREESGVKLCKDYLNVDAIEVLDPTLLHTSEDYAKLCADIPCATEPYLASYVLDITPEKQQYIEQKAQEQGLPLRIFSAGKDAELSIEEWLSIFRDAKFIITDSFHGTVFSILFHKPFLVLTNEKRGASRFESLLGKFGLENRIITSLEQSISAIDIDWQEIDDRLNNRRNLDKEFLQKAMI